MALTRLHGARAGRKTRVGMVKEDKITLQELANISNIPRITIQTNAYRLKLMIEYLELQKILQVH